MAEVLTPATIQDGAPMGLHMQAVYFVLVELVF